MCDCEVCKQNRSVQKNLNNIEDKDLRKFFAGLYESHIEVEQDRDRYKAIINGTWPRADEILTDMRKAHREKHAEDYL
jgi:hypothetical protein